MSTGSWERTGSTCCARGRGRAARGGSSGRAPSTSRTPMGRRMWCSSRTVPSPPDVINGSGDWNRLDGETHNATDFLQEAAAFDSGLFSVRCDDPEQTQNIKLEVTVSNPLFTDGENDEMSLSLDCYDCQFPGGPGQ